jgi:hypothetical protein
MTLKLAQARVLPMRTRVWVLTCKPVLATTPGRASVRSTSWALTLSRSK